jgi:hypothetical protein
MRRMTSYLPLGLRYDTSVPERCSASDAELEVLGSAACPAGSRVGGGTTTIAFLGRFPTTMSLDVFNNTNEQIMLIHSVGLSSVARGRIFPDGSIEYAGPTCFPSVPPAGCPVDNVLQLSSSVTVPPYTRTVNGVVGSYITTPPVCPPAGAWENPVRFWWADGSVDTVVIHEPCRTL